jgi:hypothetical protein
MNKQLRNAIEMIAAGYSVEVVLDITGVEPELLLDVLSSMTEPQTANVVEVTEHFNTEAIGRFVVNVN